MSKTQENISAARLDPLPQPGIDLMAAPNWWLSRPQEIREFLESLPGVEVAEIGKSAGGRPIIAASHGPREMLPGRTAMSLGPRAAQTGRPWEYYDRRIHLQESLARQQ